MIYRIKITEINGLPVNESVSIEDSKGRGTPIIINDLKRIFVRNKAHGVVCEYPMRVISKF